MFRDTFHCSIFLSSNSLKAEPFRITKALPVAFSTPYLFAPPTPLPRPIPPSLSSTPQPSTPPLYSRPSTPLPLNPPPLYPYPLYLSPTTGLYVPLWTSNPLSVYPLYGPFYCIYLSNPLSLSTSTPVPLCTLYGLLATVSPPLSPLLLSEDNRLRGWSTSWQFLSPLPKAASAFSRRH